MLHIDEYIIRVLILLIFECLACSEENDSEAGYFPRDLQGTI